jgi:glycerophosphoryl diester phosphodiesterase
MSASTSDHQVPASQIASAGEPAFFAHRFGRAYGPDSSRLALASALGGPVDGLETDCTLTADGRIVLLHDPLLHRGTTLTGWAHDHTAAEISASFTRDRSGRPSAEHPLLLHELWPMLGDRKLTVQLEVKAICDDALAARTCQILCDELLIDVPPATVTIEVISFWPDALAVAAAAGFATRLIVAAPHEPVALRRWATDQGVTGLILEAEFWADRHLDEWREAGLSVMSGVCNDAVLARRVLQFGPDAISTDRPHELRRELLGDPNGPYEPTDR